MRVAVKAVAEQAVKGWWWWRYRSCPRRLRDRIRSNVPTGKIARAAFFERPAWQRTAALYIDSPDSAAMDVWSWDLNSLRMLRDEAFKENERRLAARLQERVLRSVLQRRVVADCRGDFNASFTGMLDVIRDRSS